GVIARDAQAPFIQSEALLLGLRLESLAKPGVAPSSFQDVRQFGESGDTVAILPIYKAAALLGLAEVCLRMEDSIGARQWADRAVKLVPRGVGMAIGQSLLGAALFQEHKLDLALEQMLLAASGFDSYL